MLEANYRYQKNYKITENDLYKMISGSIPKVPENALLRYRSWKGIIGIQSESLFTIDRNAMQQAKLGFGEDFVDLGNN